MNDPIVNALAKAHLDMSRKAIELALQEKQASRRVYVFLENTPECKFRAGKSTNTAAPKGLSEILDVSPATVSKVMRTHFGMKADGRGYYYWSRPDWMKREAEQAAAHVSIEEPAPDEFATRPMPPYVEAEPVTDDPFGVDDGDYDQPETQNPFDWDPQCDWEPDDEYPVWVGGDNLGGECRNCGKYILGVAREGMCSTCWTVWNS